ncbi:hypothetical protein ABGB07_10575 [Micromonosporaceae bacterium B7E4]
MRQGRADWAQRWNAGRLDSRVTELLRHWSEDPAGAAGQLDALLRAATPQSVLFLAETYRRRHHSLEPLLSTGTGGSTGTGAGRFVEDSGSYPTGVAALLTLDRSGRLREAGLRRLAASEERFVLPYLLLRLDDPVDPVRDLAVDAVRHRQRVDGAEVLVPMAPLLDRLAVRRRAGPLVRALRP